VGRFFFFFKTKNNPGVALRRTDEVPRGEDGALHLFLKWGDGPTQSFGALHLLRVDFSFFQNKKHPACCPPLRRQGGAKENGALHLLKKRRRLATQSFGALHLLRVVFFFFFKTKNTPRTLGFRRDFGQKCASGYLRPPI
jgi:hypothetical protein